MTEQELEALKPQLDRFLTDYAPLFGREENVRHAGRFVQGLLDGRERRSVENIAQAIDGCNVRNLQAFITTGSWRDKDVLDLLRKDALGVLADDDAIWNSDETGFPKKGDKSVGVKRQYSGTLGRTDNCQVGVFANYCSVKGHTLVDRRLYLPKEEWAEDQARRDAAGVPQEVVFRTKPELALEMLSDACASGVPFRWVGGDSVYGDSLTFVRGARSLGKWYVLDVTSDTLVWAEEPEVIPPEQRQRGGRGGRPPSKPEIRGERQRVDELIAKLPASAWQRVTVAEGSQGPRIYEYVQRWVWFAEGELPGPCERLLVRRSIGQEPELKYHRSNAPREVTMEKVAQVRATRWTIEEDVQCGKGECGLDEYETRGWVGWHHHTALSMLALLFLVLQKHRLGEKRGGVGKRARGASAAGASVGGAPLGHRRDPEMVELAAREESPSRRQSPQTPPRQTQTAKK
jgi:SRSO17 transposase